MTGRRPHRRAAGHGRPRGAAAVGLVLAAALLAGCTSADASGTGAAAGPGGPSTSVPSATAPGTTTSLSPPGPGSPSATSGSATSTTATGPTGAATGGASAAPAAPGLPTTVQPVPRGDLATLQVTRGATEVLQAAFSGLARYDTSDSCEVPGQPCYDAPTFDKVARIDLGAPPTVPGADTTFITGHSNRYHPDDPSKGVFSRLQGVRTGDTLVLRTTTGVFVYDVTTVLTVPFDKLTTTDAVVRVRPDTVVAISCEIAPDLGSYLGNYVVVATLRASARG